jgi:hypothetical protein
VVAIVDPDALDGCVDREEYNSGGCGSGESQATENEMG